MAEDKLNRIAKLANDAVDNKIDVCFHSIHTEMLLTFLFYKFVANLILFFKADSPLTHVH